MINTNTSSQIIENTDGYKEVPDFVELPEEERNQAQRQFLKKNHPNPAGNLIEIADVEIEAKKLEDGKKSASKHEVLVNKSASKKSLSKKSIMKSPMAEKTIAPTYPNVSNVIILSDTKPNQITESKRSKFTLKNASQDEKANNFSQHHNIVIKTEKFTQSKQNVEVIYLDDKEEAGKNFEKEDEKDENENMQDQTPAKNQFRPSYTHQVTPHPKALQEVNEDDEDGIPSKLKIEENISKSSIKNEELNENSSKIKENDNSSKVIEIQDKIDKEDIEIAPLSIKKLPCEIPEVKEEILTEQKENSQRTSQKIKNNSNSQVSKDNENKEGLGVVIEVANSKNSSKLKSSNKRLSLSKDSKAKDEKKQEGNEPDQGDKEVCKDDEVLNEGVRVGEVFKEEVVNEEVIKEEVLNKDSKPIEIVAEMNSKSLVLKEITNTEMNEKVDISSPKFNSKKNTEKKTPLNEKSRKKEQSNIKGINILIIVIIVFR